MRGLQSTITGFQNSLGGIHGNITKLQKKLGSHFSQCVYSVASSRNVQAGGTKLVDSILNLKNSTFGKSNRAHGLRGIEPEDIGHIPNSLRDDEHYHDESDQPQPYHLRDRY